MECLDERAAHGLISGALDATTSAAAREHIDSCDDCRDLVAAAASESPQTIGRYQIVATIGGGAMGIVYEAIDPQLERRVAIKMLRDDAHRERLLREARAVAQISHPNVIAVFDAGITGDGDVFMAMELIRGKTLRKWLEEHRRSQRDIVAAMVKVGRGLAAIHRAQLVHRDVKPDNVLVAEDGRVLVTDFGLVRLEPDARGKTTPAALELTQTGAFVGTPAYAAPEQLDGPAETDARGDQFSYCVTLHEALTGTRPFVGANLAELRAAIDSGPPALDAPAPIVAAVKRGLALDPAARWPSMDALVTALEDAIAPRRTARWIAAAGMGAVAALAAVMWVRRAEPEARCDAGAAELARVWNPAVTAKLAAGFAQSKVPYAASTWTATARALDGYAVQWARAYDDACAATNVRHAQSPGILDLRTQCLARRRGELAALVDALVAPDATQLELAPSAAAALLSPDVCADAELLAATDPLPDGPELRAQVARARGDLARVQAQSSLGHYQEALALARETSALAAKLAYAPLVAEVDALHGRIAIDLHEWDEATRQLDSALLAAERGRHHRVRGDVQLARAFLAMQRGDHTGALAELERADAVVTGLGNQAANRARVEDYRGTALAALGKLDDAKRALDLSVSLYEAADGAQSISLANPLTQLAYVANQRGDLPAAVTLLERALAIQSKAFGPEHPRLGFAHTNLAFNLAASGNLESATKHAEAARTILGSALGTETAPYAQALRALVGIWTARHDFAKAETFAREAVAVLAKQSGVDHPDYASAVEDLANARRALRHLDDALTLHQQVLQIRQHALPAGHPSIVSSLINVADVLADLARCKDAQTLYARAAEHSDGPDVPPYLAIAVRLGRGRCLVDAGQRATAVPILREALARNIDPQGDEDRGLRALTRFLLAQAVPARDEARELATAARAEAEAIHDDDLDKRVATWLVEHP